MGNEKPYNRSRSTHTPKPCSRLKGTHTLFPSPIKLSKITIFYWGIIITWRRFIWSFEYLYIKIFRASNAAKWRYNLMGWFFVGWLLYFRKEERRGSIVRAFLYWFYLFRFARPRKRTIIKYVIKVPPSFSRNNMPEYMPQYNRRTRPELSARRKIPAPFLCLFLLRFRKDQKL